MNKKILFLIVIFSISFISASYGDEYYGFEFPSGNISYLGNYSYYTVNATTNNYYGGNISWNQSFADTLYAGIEWDYNQTIPAMAYTDSVNTTTTNWINNIFLKIADLASSVVSMVGNWSSDKPNYYTKTQVDTNLSLYYLASNSNAYINITSGQVFNETARLDILNASIISLADKVVIVNNTLYLINNSLTGRINSVNSTLYLINETFTGQIISINNSMLLINNTLDGRITSVNNSYLLADTNINSRIDNLNTTLNIQNLYNSTLTQGLNMLNTTLNIQNLLGGTNISQYAFNQTLQTFNTYNSTWDNNWVNQFAYNHTASTIGIIGTNFSTLTNNLNSVNTTLNIQNLLNSTGIYTFAYNHTASTIGIIGSNFTTLTNNLASVNTTLNIQNLYNSTIPQWFGIYLNAGTNASYLTTYNATYATWAYNQTTPAINILNTTYGANWYNHTLATYNAYDGRWYTTNNGITLDYLNLTGTVPSAWTTTYNATYANYLYGINNETIATFNLYNTTWDNNWVNQFAYNHTLATYNLYDGRWYTGNNGITLDALNITNIPASWTTTYNSTYAGYYFGASNETLATYNLYDGRWYTPNNGITLDYSNLTGTVPSAWTTTYNSTYAGYYFGASNETTNTYNLYDSRWYTPNNGITLDALNITNVPTSWTTTYNSTYAGYSFGAFNHTSIVYSLWDSRWYTRNNGITLDALNITNVPLSWTTTYNSTYAGYYFGLSNETLATYNLYDSRWYTPNNGITLDYNNLTGTVPSAWTTTYNSTYAGYYFGASNETTATYNLYNTPWSTTYNSTYNTWAYNQTAPANSYTDGRITAVNSTGQLALTINSTAQQALTINTTANIGNLYNSTALLFAQMVNTTANIQRLVNSTYVPYNGATANTNLGIFNLTTSGAINYTKTDGTIRYFSNGCYEKVNTTGIYTIC